MMLAGPRLPASSVGPWLTAQRPIKVFCEKSHAAWLPVADGYPANWQPPDAKAIYIIRDPRAVAVSWAHHIGHSPQDAVDIMATEGG